MHRSPAPLAPSASRAPAAPHAAGSLDGEWREFGLLQVEGHSLIYDAAHDELLSVGGSQLSNWALPLTGVPEWQPLPPTPSPHYLYPYSTAEDPATGLLFFPGFAYPGFEVATLDPRTGAVNTIAATGAPGVHLPSLLRFDPVSQRVIIQGGYDQDGLPTDAVWALDLQPTPAWSQLSPTGVPPPWRFPLYSVIDPVRRYLLVFPDFIYAPSESAAVWALTLDAPHEWLHFPTNGPPNGTMTNPFVYDAASDRVRTFGTDGDVYSLDPASWQWTEAPVGGPGPSGRRNAGLAVDALRHRLLVSGGRTPWGEDIHSDTWALSLDGPLAWTQLVPEPVRPPTRTGASDGLDLSRNRLVVFGGSNELGGFRNDTWALDLAATPAWFEVATQGGPPPGRYWHASAWDEVRDQLLVYGGYNGDSSHPLGDLWALSFGGGMPAWTPISPAGTGPTARMTTTLVRDASRDRFLLLFGYDGLAVLDDVWELKLAPAPAWRRLTPAGAPPPARAASMAAFDPVHDRVIAFGGSTAFDYFGDAWALDFTGGGDGAWQPIASPPGPSGRNLALLRLDTAHNRLLLFGGYGVHHVEGNVTVIQWLDDTWALNLSGTPAWQALAPAGQLPPARDRMNGAYDPFYDRLLVTCGSVGGGGVNDLHALTFGDAPTPTLLALASRDVTADRVRLVWAGAGPGESVTAYRRAEGAAWASLGELAADGEGFVTLEDRDVAPGAVLEYRLGVTGASGETYFGATLVQVPLRTLSLAGRAHGGRVSFTVGLPSDGPASLALFDLAGRRVWSTDVGQLGPGTHEVTVAGAALPPALYFGRLVQGGLARDARVVVTR